MLIFLVLNVEFSAVMFQTVMYCFLGSLHFFLIIQDLFQRTGLVTALQDEGYFSIELQGARRPYIRIRTYTGTGTGWQPRQAISDPECLTEATA